MDQQLREDLNRSLDESRTPIGDETAKLCAHMQAFAERLKPGRFLRYLEARAAEVADRAGVEAGSKRSVVYAVPRLDRDGAARYNDPPVLHLSPTSCI